MEAKSVLGKLAATSNYQFNSLYDVTAFPERSTLLIWVRPISSVGSHQCLDEP